MDGLSDTLRTSLAHSATAATSAAREGTLAELKSPSLRSRPAEAAQKFEALFASQLVKEMRQTLSSGFFGDGPQADVYAAWLDQFLGEAIAKDGGLRLAQQLRTDLERPRAPDTNQEPSR
jgi:Rod binding domain-containing protein